MCQQQPIVDVLEDLYPLQTEVGCGDDHHLRKDSRRRQEAEGEGCILVMRLSHSKPKELSVKWAY